MSVRVVNSSPAFDRIGVDMRKFYSYDIEQHENTSASQAAYVGSIPITRSSLRYILCRTHVIVYCAPLRCARGSFALRPQTLTRGHMANPITRSSFSRLNLRSFSMRLQP